MREAADSVDIEALLERSQGFERAIQDCFPETGFLLAITDQRHELVATACVLSVEHAGVLRAAFATAAPNTGSALLRLQYEALLRAAWLLYAASPDHVAKLAATLDLEAEQAAKKLPGYIDMLDALVKKAPAGLSRPLAEFNQYSRHALNSYVHSGIHPLRRAREGYPAPMGVTVIRFSNGLMHFAYRLLASLSGSQQRMDRVTRLFEEFQDCVPMATNRPTLGASAG
jgi:hypothetical protein